MDLTVYRLASIPSLCYLHLGSFELAGVEKQAICVCARNPSRGQHVNVSSQPSIKITAYGFCSLPYHNPDSGDERVSELEALQAIREGARISKTRLSIIGPELDSLLEAGDKAYERIRAARLMELRRIAAARAIQRQWIPIVCDPQKSSTRQRLMREFDLLVAETEMLLQLRKEAAGGEGGEGV